MKVDFKFNVGQFILDPFGKKCLIDMAAISSNNSKSYLVLTGEKSIWYSEEMLKEMPASNS